MPTFHPADESNPSRPAGAKDLADPKTDEQLRAADLRVAFDGAWRSMGGAGEAVLALFFELSAWRPWLGDALTSLDDAEQTRVRSKTRVGHGEDLALAYALHRLTLACALQREPAQVALGRDPAGRPWLPDDELHTSLSHADGFVAVAVSRRGPIGIDLELVARASIMVSIAERVCHPDEAFAIAGLPEAERAAALLALWVRKEALLKAAGIGLQREMQTFLAPADQILRLPVADGDDAVIRMLDPGPDWLAAVAGVRMATPQAIWMRP